jgi:hypothetical protein
MTCKTTSVPHSYDIFINGKLRPERPIVLLEEGLIRLAVYDHEKGKWIGNRNQVVLENFRQGKGVKIENKNYGPLYEKSRFKLRGVEWEAF